MSNTNENVAISLLGFLAQIGKAYDMQKVNFYGEFSMQFRMCIDTYNFYF